MATVKQLVDIYTAIPGRAPDSEGLAFWAGSNDSLEQIAQYMWTSPQTQALYPAYLTPTQIVERIYQNVLGREADEEGLAFWVGRWNANGAGNEGKTLLEMIDSINNYNGNDPAGIASKELFQAKAEFGEWFATVLESNDLDLAKEGYDILNNGGSVADAQAAVTTNTLVINDAGDYKVASDVNAILVNDIDLTDDIVATLTSAQDVRNINVFETAGRDVNNPVNVQFLEIQDINVDIKIVDSLAVNYLFSYDFDAYDGDNVVNLHLEEVGANFGVEGQSPVIAFGTTAQGAGSSEIKQLNITSNDRAATAKDDHNYLQALVVGSELTSVIIDGDSSFGVSEFLDQNVSLVDAGANAESQGDLDANLELKLHAQGIAATPTPTLTVYGALGNDSILIDGDGNNLVELGTGNDTLLIEGNGYNDVDLGEGHDLLTINGPVSDGFVDAGAGNDTVFLNVGTVVEGDYGEDVAVSIAHYDVRLGEGNDLLTVTGAGSHYIHGGEGNDTVNLYGLNTLPFWDYDQDDAGLNYGSTVNGGAGVDNVNGSEKNDFITAINVEHIFGDGGEDLIQIYRTEEDPTGNVTVDGGWGEDTVDIAHAIDGIVRTFDVEEIWGSTGNDTVVATHADWIYVNAGAGNDDITVGNGNSNTSTVWDAYVFGEDGDDVLTVTVRDDAEVYGGNGNDTITVSAGDEAWVDGGNGDDVINVNTYGSAEASIIGGAGNDTINLSNAQIGGTDTIIFGDIYHDHLQGQVVNSQGTDTITGFNFEGDTGGDPLIDSQDRLDFSTFLELDADISVYTAPTVVESANWNDGTQEYKVITGGVGILVVDDNFVLNQNKFSTVGTADGTLGISNNEKAVVILTRGDSINGLQDFEVYFVQDVDSGPGQTWAIDLVANIEGATAVGLQTVVDNVLGV